MLWFFSGLEAVGGWGLEKGPSPATVSSLVPFSRRDDLSTFLDSLGSLRKEGKELGVTGLKGAQGKSCLSRYLAHIQFPNAQVSPGK